HYGVTGLYTGDIVAIRTEFIKDWNAKFGTSYVNLNHLTFAPDAKTGSAPSNTTIAGTNLQKFFSDPDLGLKWSWLLDLFIDVGSGTVHTAKQATAVKNGGTHPTLTSDNLYYGDMLIHSIYNLFCLDNKFNNSDSSTIKFADYETSTTTQDRLFKVITYNNSIMKDVTELLPKNTV